MVSTDPDTGHDENCDCSGCKEMWDARRTIQRNDTKIGQPKRR